MMSHPNRYPHLPLGTMLPFAQDGKLYRFSNHVVAAGDGWILMVPMFLVLGSLRHLSDGCPVAWDELDRLRLDARRAVHAFDFSAENWSRLVLGLTDLATDGWELDFIKFGHSNVWRFVHPAGIRFAATDGVVYGEEVAT
ncbi:MAG: hypothetical protein K8H84_00105 [Sulfuricella denitrificans]|nr:hypothetical protein [Sulfuricella denitrificans]